MNVPKVNISSPKINAYKLAKTICKTKNLPSDITLERASKILTAKYAKSYGTTLLAIMGGIGPSFALLASESLLGIMAGALLLPISSVLAIETSYRNRKIEEAYGILNDGKYPGDNFIKSIKEPRVKEDTK